MKGTLPGAALPPCRRPQRGSQSRERPPPGTGSSPGLTPQDQPQGVTPAATDGNRQDDHRASPRSTRPQRRSGTPKRRRTRPQRVKAGRDKGTTAERSQHLDFAVRRRFLSANEPAAFLPRAPFSARFPDAEGGGKVNRSPCFPGTS